MRTQPAIAMAIAQGCTGLSRHATAESVGWVRLQLQPLADCSPDLEGLENTSLSVRSCERAVPRQALPRMSWCRSNEGFEVSCRLLQETRRCPRLVWYPEASPEAGTRRSCLVWAGPDLGNNKRHRLAETSKQMPKSQTLCDLQGNLPMRARS